MKSSIVPSQNNSSSPKFTKLNKWFFSTPERSLEEAYQAALKIQKIEKEHFNGQTVSESSGKYTKNVVDCFVEDVDNKLTYIKLKITEFKVSRLFLRHSNYEFINKLKFIDETLNRYQELEKNILSINSNNNDSSSQKNSNNKPSNVSQVNLLDFEKPAENFKKTGALPRSIGKTLKKIQIDMSPKAEEELVQKFRSSRRVTRQAISVLILLILIPLLCQKISKEFIFLPLIENYRNHHEVPIFINSEMKEEALRELQAFEEELKFEKLLHHIPNFSPELLENKVTKKAQEIEETFHQKGTNAISNVFADLTGLAALLVVVAFNSQGMVAIKLFLNDIIYGLSDSAKAFILILFTDIFVGFHSPHGWEVLLEGIANHLGIAANHSAIFLFIATFPVILDTVFKYWIFRYLNQISPSAVATLKNMNE
ncbi:proton extrusion protein PcxA [Crocosphaera sp. UHCC 0190]|uniref:proton extrusion protein PcxA n=1 Tax=Crocosphaera sp. UHCC 0190 TaxID=3110246 RepID=UPI002B21600B|nr:proton extrusion protein PcxA [Crocosphaera sp. UHCC 0190]MEA5509463.1 proton extrusion protein PcxA [Crocosphaera sp. UHCC 0190]